jgi:hypothetical protein
MLNNGSSHDVSLPAKIGAWLILKRASWIGYLLGLIVIGICDLTFLFAMVVSGVIELNAGTVGGPVLWFLAVVVTPFALPTWRRA